jgi:Putative zinc-finger
MMLNCKQASHLLSQSMERKLPLWQRLSLRIHLMLCDACAQFSLQLETLRLAMEQLGRKFVNDDSLTLPDEARRRIALAMARRSKSDAEARQHPD